MHQDLGARHSVVNGNGHAGSLALDGTNLGQRGLRTRARLLDGLREALAGTNGGWASVAEISRSAGVSAATFYRYFRDVDEASLALAEELIADTTRIADLVSPDWRGDAGLDNVIRFVDAFLEHWEENRPTLRMRNLAAETGDERFRRVRLQTLRVITRAISTKIKEGQAAGLVNPAITPATGATVIVGMLERVGDHVEGYATRTGRRDVVRTVSMMIQTVVCGSAATPVSSPKDTAASSRT
jgi:AcrR family transcriptional regulator